MPRVYTGPIWLLDQPQTARNHTLVFKGRVRSVAAGSVVVVSLENGTVQTAFLGLPSSDIVRGNASRWLMDWAMPVNPMAHLWLFELDVIGCNSQR